MSQNTPKKPRRGGSPSKLDGLRAEMATTPDSKIALMAGVTRHAVYMYRRRHKLATLVDPESRRGGRRKTAAPEAGATAPAKVAKAPKAPKEAKPAGGKKAARAGGDDVTARLAPFRDALAHMPDGVVATASGVPKAVVREYRLAQGIHKKPGRPSANKSSDIERFLAGAGVPAKAAAPKAAEAPKAVSAPKAPKAAAPKALAAEAPKERAVAPAPSAASWAWRVTVLDAKGAESDVIASGATMADAVAAAGAAGTVIGAARLARFVG
jgi:hypothetical protein